MSGTPDSPKPSTEHNFQTVSDPEPAVVQPEENDASASHDHPLAVLGQARKNVLLFTFSAATFLDLCNVSGVALAIS